MDLKEFFVSQCRIASSVLGIESPAVKKLTASRNSKEETGVCAALTFDGFKVLVSYMESGRAAYAQQTIWVSVSLDCDRTIPFSLYDILSFIDPQNFNCYTYTYVDSQELMEGCINELTQLLKRIAPLLSQFLQDGINKNKLLAAQKESINKYFGDSVFESGEMLGGAADNLIAMMLQNFYEAEIEAAVVGTQSYFYNGEDEKALKKLQKAKRKTLYQENLQKYLESGGTSNNISKTAKEASLKKGVLRHGGGVKASFKTILLSLLFTVPVFLCLALIYICFCFILFRGNVFITGFFENIIILPFFSFPLGIAFSLNFTKQKAENRKHKDSKSVHTPKSPRAVNELLKYFTIITETLALIGCITCVFSSTVFYKESFKYSEADFPFSQSSCDYSSIEFAGVIEGLCKDNKFYEEKYVVLRTVSGQTIDLYNSTWLSYDIITENEAFFNDKGIEIKTFKTYEDYESYK